MRCPSCDAENEAAAARCKACQAALPASRRTRRRRSDVLEERPLSPEAQAYNQEVLRLYRWCLLAAVPFLSLALGPLLAYRAYRFRRRAADPALAGAVPVDIAFWLGVCSAAASWLGLGLMVLGLYL